MTTISKKPIAIIGVGNYLMGDEGVGIHAIEELRKLEWPDYIEIIDGGTIGIGLLHLIEGRKLAIIIDCADFGGKAGDIRVLKPSDLLQDKYTKNGLHSTDLLTALELANCTGNTAKQIYIIGIQPTLITVGIKLSNEIQSILSSLHNLIFHIIRQG